MIFARKNNKIPEFYTVFARKMPEFYIKIAQKYFPDFFLGGGGHVSPAPVSYEAMPMLRINEFATEFKHIMLP